MLQNHIWQWHNVELAWQKASKGKRGKEAVAEFEFYLADNLLDLQNELKERSYKPSGYDSFYIHEPKKRLISSAPFRDRVVHHALCNLTTPYFEKKFIPDSYANRVGKGTHRALDRCQQFARRYKYYLQCDIVQFFPSIDHELMRIELEKALPDESLSWLTNSVLSSGRDVLAEEYEMIYFPNDDIFAKQRQRGLPIGNLTSQWWGNLYLNVLDQFIKRELSCKAYLRYVDDFVLFADDKKTLREWRRKIIERLQRYRLILHEERALPRPVTDGIRFLGFVIYPDYRLLKRKKGISFQRKLKKLVNTASDEKIEASVQGWINHVRYGDTWGLRKAILAKENLLARSEYGN